MSVLVAPDGSQAGTALWRTLACALRGAAKWLIRVWWTTCSAAHRQVTLAPVSPSLAGTTQPCDVKQPEGVPQPLSTPVEEAQTARHEPPGALLCILGYSRVSPT